MLDIGPGLVNVREVQPGPQRRMGYEGVPPATAHSSQRGQILIHLIFEIVVRKRREDFGGGSGLWARTSSSWTEPI